MCFLIHHASCIRYTQYSLVFVTVCQSVRTHIIMIIQFIHLVWQGRTALLCSVLFRAARGCGAGLTAEGHAHPVFPKPRASKPRYNIMTSLVCLSVSFSVFVSALRAFLCYKCYIHHFVFVICLSLKCEDPPPPSFPWSFVRYGQPGSCLSCRPKTF